MTISVHCRTGSLETDDVAAAKNLASSLPYRQFRKIATAAISGGIEMFIPYTEM